MRFSEPQQDLCDAYDAAEAGFNIFIQRVKLDLSNPLAAIDRLLTEQKRLPLQARRDQNQIDFQQFSTPPAEALVVVKAAALCVGMTECWYGQSRGAGTADRRPDRHQRNRPSPAGITVVVRF